MHKFPKMCSLFSLDIRRDIQDQLDVFLRVKWVLQEQLGVNVRNALLTSKKKYRRS